MRWYTNYWNRSSFQSCNVSMNFSSSAWPCDHCVQMDLEPLYIRWSQTLFNALHTEMLWTLCSQIEVHTDSCHSAALLRSSSSGARILARDNGTVLKGKLGSNPGTLHMTLLPLLTKLLKHPFPWLKYWTTQPFLLVLWINRAHKHAMPHLPYDPGAVSVCNYWVIACQLTSPRQPLHLPHSQSFLKQRIKVLFRKINLWLPYHK